MLLSKMVTWMRRQSGTTDLRALVYMDEVAGYVPPTANPPTKKPIMTLMKQARAFGVGVVLSTQNPVDLDYKAISNAGTWMVGRLQTERDKARLLDGMSAAAGTVDVQAVSSTISGLGKREFVLQRAGKDQPDVFTTRWAMSYLRGPAHPRPDQPAHGRPGAGERGARAVGGTDRRTATRSGPGGRPDSHSGHSGRPARPRPRLRRPPSPPTRRRSMPEVAAGVPVRWLDAAAPWALQVGAVAGGTRLQPAAVARINLRFDEEKADLVADEEWEAVLYPLAAQPDPATAVAVDYDDRDLLAEAPPSGGAYAIPDAPIKQKTYWTGLQRDLVDWLVRNRTTSVFTNKTLKLYSRVGEDQAAFVARCQEAGQAKADDEAAKLRDKYRTKLQAIETKQAAARGEGVGGRRPAPGAAQRAARQRHRHRARCVPRRAPAHTLADRRPQHGGPVRTARQRPAAALRSRPGCRGAGAGAPAGAGRHRCRVDQKAADVTVADVRLEKADVSVAQVCLVWIPT